MKNRIEKNYDDFKPIKAGKSSPSVLVPYRNRSGMVELVGREPLMFARVENGVTKFSPKKQKTPKCWIKTAVFNGDFFCRRTTNFFGGGYNFKTG